MSHRRLRLVNANPFFCTHENVSFNKRPTGEMQLPKSWNLLISPTSSFSRAEFNLSQSNPAVAFCTLSEKNTPNVATRLFTRSRKTCTLSGSSFRTIVVRQLSTLENNHSHVRIGRFSWSTGAQWISGISVWQISFLLCVWKISRLVYFVTRLGCTCDIRFDFLARSHMVEKTVWRSNPSLLVRTAAIHGQTYCNKRPNRAYSDTLYSLRLN